MHLQLEDEFSQLIRRGYTGRHPFARNTVAMRHCKDLESIKSTGFSSTASNLTVIGMSGMGKTTAIDAVTRLYPQVIIHKKYQTIDFIQTQVVWLKVECSHDGSLRGFCASFFDALDLALGTDDYSRLATSHLTVDLLLQKIGRLCRSYYVGAIIIDEMQHLNARKSNKESLLNFLVKLSNEAGVPVVYVGTNAMLDIFSTVVRNARRATGMNMIAFDRFEINDNNWNLLLSQVWRYDWLGSATKLTDELRLKIYERTQGNVDFLIKLLILAQRCSLYNEDKKITTEVIDEVYQQQMKILHRAIDVLKSRDPKRMLTFDDLMPAKDQIVEMMSFDIARKNRTIDLAKLYQQHNSSPEINTSKAPEHSKPIEPTMQGSAKDLHNSTNLRDALITEGWVRPKK